MSLDTAAIKARFMSAFDVSSNQVLTLDKPLVAPDKNKVWVRFSVQPQSKGRTESGVNPRYLQLGSVYLQVFIPKTLGISAAEAMLSKFEDLFCDWTSPDGAVLMGRMTRDQSEETNNYMVTIGFRWTSTRAKVN